MKKLKIVLLNWNGKHWLKQFLPKVVAYSPNASVVVIDNLSTDDSIAYIKTNFPEVEIVQNQKNYGFAKGYNEGLKQIKADYYCLLNTDVEVTPNWTDAVLQIFENETDIAVIQPKIRSYKEKEKFEFAGAAGGFLDNLGYPYCRGRIFETIETDIQQYEDEQDIFWAGGCAFFIRSKDFWNQNGLDEDFFAHQEEIDLCWRLKNVGKRIFYTSKSVVYHVGGATLEKNNPYKTYLNFRNNLCMLFKNLPFPQLAFIIVFRLILDGVAGIYMGYKNGYKHFLAVVHAHFGFYALIPKMWKKRQSHQISEYFGKKYLVFQYYLKK